MRSTLVIILMFSFLTGLKCQLLPEIEELRLKMPGYDESKLERSMELIQEAESLMGEARDLYSEGDERSKNKAWRALDKASENHLSAKEFSYLVYINHIDNFLEEVSVKYSKELERGKHFQAKAEMNLEKAEKLRKKIANTDSFSLKFNRLFEVYEYERLGIINLARTLRVFQDWPIEYDYVWDDFKREIDPFLVEDRIRDSISAIQERNPKSKDTTVTFRAQIAAHTIQMDESYLRNAIYKGERKINMIRNDGWYKYDIGVFPTYNEAAFVVQTCGVDKAFVAAYRQGERIDMSEAIQRVSGNYLGP